MFNKKKNYRPISLLNSDYKIFAGVLAARLKCFLNQFIHPDQNGFLSNRYLRDNLRMVMNVLEYFENRPDKQLALIFVDAQKAFDRVSWDFMITQLEYMDFGDKFIQAIKAIYQEQTATALIDGEETQKIQICRGTRQGCPLSPLLFILSLEPLLREVRENPEIKGMKIRREEVKIQAYADDLVFILDQPLDTGPKLIYIIREYGKVAGLLMNEQKSKMLVKNISQTQKQQLEQTIGLKMTNKIKYLGIWLSARCSSIKEDNYIPMFKNMTRDLERWKNLQLSLLGRIAAIKMCILPKWLFLFQVAPVKLNKDFFVNLDRCISKFIWQGKKPRIRYKILQEPKASGGFGLPNWETYYQAANLTWLADWMTLKKKRLLMFEGAGLQYGWHFFMWPDPSGRPKHFEDHYIRKTLGQVWEKIRKKVYSKIPCWISPQEAQIYPTLYKGEKILTYEILLDPQGNLKTRESLISQGYNVDWWPYSQIYSRYKKDLQKIGIYNKKQELDKILLEGGKGMLSKCYAYLSSLQTGQNREKDCMVAWGRNFGYPLDYRQWEQIWLRNIKLTMASGYKENIYKMIHRWHLPPARLAKMFPGTSSCCWKCGHSKGTYFHQWWSCPQANKYWKTIQRWIWEILQIKLQLRPETFLLGAKPLNINVTKWFLLTHIITAARITFAQGWKNQDLPTDSTIIYKVNECAEMDRLTRLINGKKDSDFYNIWKEWYNWVQKRWNRIDN